MHATPVTTAALAVCVFLPAAAGAQVIPFAGNFGQGLAASDNQMMFDSVARLNAVEPSKVGQSNSWSDPETKSSEIPPLEEVEESWRRCVETSLNPPGDICRWADAQRRQGPTYLVQPRSVAACLPGNAELSAPREGNPAERLKIYSIDQ
jgi:hypothetical protein